MNQISEADADDYASWFRALADGTRIRILNHVAAAAEPVTVGQIVEAIGKSQSTVSRHLQVLAEDRFVFAQADGVRTLITANRACMTELPRAAAAIMAVSDVAVAGPTASASDGADDDAEADEAGRLDVAENGPARR